jgi:hypothetical protein
MSAKAADVSDVPVASTIATNVPTWRTNACLVSVRGVIWNDKIIAGHPIKISLLVKNVSKGDVFVPKKFNCNNQSFAAEQGVRSVHGDGVGAVWESDYLRLQPLDVTVFSREMFAIEEPVSGQLTVNFHNNEASEERVAPQRHGIPIVNDLSYDFGSIVVYAPVKTVQRTLNSGSAQDPNRTTPTAGSGR